MSCEGFNPATCPSQPWHPCCDPCGPPGGGGFAHFLPHYDGPPFVSQHGQFYVWEAPLAHAFRVLRVNQDGTVDIRVEYSGGHGECYKPGMPYAKSKSEVDTYLLMREKRLEIFSRHLDEFGQAWRAAHGSKLPSGGFHEGTYYLPRREGHDCPGLPLRWHASDSLVDLRITYASGNGWSNVRLAPVFTSRRKLQEMLDLRAAYCEMLAPYQELAEAEWRLYKGESY